MSLWSGNFRWKVLTGNGCRMSCAGSESYRSKKKAARAGRSKESVLAFLSCLITQIQDRRLPVTPHLNGTSFSGAKQLLYEDQIEQFL
jgi:hypothetical protein